MDQIIKKAVLFTFIFSLPVFSCYADEGESGSKNIRVGLKVTPMMSWLRPDDKSITGDGAKAKFGFGLMAEFRITNVLSFATGIGGDYEGGKLSFSDSATYYSNGDELLTASDTAGKSYGLYLLNKRDFNINYLTIPIQLKMKTKDIGGITYFANFGGDLGIRMKSKVTDEVTLLDGNLRSTLEDLDNTKDINLLRLSLNVGGGIEYNLSGSTSIVLGLNYRRGFMSAVKKKSEFLREGISDNDFRSSALGDAVLLTVGVLF